MLCKGIPKFWLVTGFYTYILYPCSSALNAVKHFFYFLLLAPFFCLGQFKPGLRSTSWYGTHSPLVKGTELYFLGDTLYFIDMDGVKPPDAYRFRQIGDTMQLEPIAGLSLNCPDEVPATYKLIWQNNTEKLLVKPITEPCMPRFTQMVSESPWYRKREPGQLAADWHFKNPEKDLVAGASLYEAYKFLKFRTSSPITVAVVDCPLDYTHPDLIPVLWNNPKEIAGNKADDDKNGFKDDLRGWCFICNWSGQIIPHEQKACTQALALGKARFEGKTRNQLSSPQEKQDFDQYQRALADYDRELKKEKRNELVFSDSLRFLTLLNQYLMESEEPVTEDQVDTWKSGPDAYGTALKDWIREKIRRGRVKKFETFVRDMRAGYSSEKRRIRIALDYGLNTDWSPRDFTKDHAEIPYEKMYGSGFLQDPTVEATDHGTHVAGIIGGKRGNGIGVDGVADNVKIMSLGAIPPEGDERDKDVANSIRYAVDNGAKIINMSFGKGFLIHSKVLEEALKYADTKGVLMVHAAGNHQANRDTSDFFPIPRLSDGYVVKNWIEVGNITRFLDERLVAGSSAYGKKTVDLFAPGSDIFSTTPAKTYEYFTGTSMATPMVAGVAALIWSYFPKLTAAQVKEAILKSVYKPQNLMVYRPGSREKVPFESLSVTGGILNARDAVFIAEKLNKKKKP